MPLSADATGSRKTGTKEQDGSSGRQINLGRKQFHRTAALCVYPLRPLPGVEPTSISGAVTSVDSQEETSKKSLVDLLLV